MDPTTFPANASIASNRSNMALNFGTQYPTTGKFSSSVLPHLQFSGYSAKTPNKLHDEQKAFDTMSLIYSEDGRTIMNQMPLALAESDVDMTEEEEEIINSEDFETMVADLRRPFMSWLKKTESNLKERRDKLKTKIVQFNEYQVKARKQIQIEQQYELDKLKEERRKLDAESATQIKQIQIEREDSMKKLKEKWDKFEAEKELHMRKLAMDRHKLNKDYENYEKERQRVRDHNIASETMININVGGITFETSRNTLTQQPGSFLEGILTGRYNIARDKNGSIFFDRDSEIFRIILNFLRNPSSPPVPRDAEESHAITREGEFYGIKYFPFPLVFACGGHSGTEHLRAVEVLDIAQQVWRPCKAMITERSFFGSSSIRSLLYVYGGQNLEYKALCDTEIYDCLRDTWMTGPALNIPRRNNTGVTLGERIVTIGGFDGLDVLSSVEALDTRMKNWMEICPMNTARSAAMVAVQNGKILAMGGTKGNRLRTVEVYDSRANKWENLSSELIEIRSSGAAASLHAEFVFVMGGTDNTHNVLSSCEQLNKDNTWTYVKNMPEARMDFSSTVISDSIVVSGGQNLEVLQSTDFFRPDKNEWQSGPPMLFPRYGHALLVASI